MSTIQNIYLRLVRMCLQSARKIRNRGIKMPIPVDRLEISGDHMRKNFQFRTLGGDNAIRAMDFSITIFDNNDVLIQGKIFPGDVKILNNVGIYFILKDENDVDIGESRNYFHTVPTGNYNNTSRDDIKITVNINNSFDNTERIIIGHNDYNYEQH